jgi:hypothetical protein
MLLTAAQHRAIAAYLWRAASGQPEERRQRMIASAELHSHLARLQDEDPALRPRQADAEDTGTTQR